MGCKNCKCAACVAERNDNAERFLVATHLGHKIFSYEKDKYETAVKWASTKTLDEMIQFINEFESTELSCEPFDVVYTGLGSQNDYNHINTICGYQPSAKTFKVVTYLRNVNNSSSFFVQVKNEQDIPKNHNYKTIGDVIKEYKSEGCCKYVVLDDNIKSLIKELLDIRKSIIWPVVASEDFMKQKQCSDIQQRIISEGITPIDYFNKLKA